MSIAVQPKLPNALFSPTSEIAKNITPKENEAPMSQTFAQLLNQQDKLAPVVTKEELDATKILLSTESLANAPAPELMAADAAAVLATLGPITPSTPAEQTPVSIATSQASEVPLSTVPIDAKQPQDKLPTTHVDKPLQTGRPESGKAPNPQIAVSNGDKAPAKFAATLEATQNNGASNQKALTTESEPLAPSSNLTHVSYQAAPPRDSALTVALPTPIRDPNWAGDFGQKVVWLGMNYKQSAQITLNPPQMGPIEIVVNVEKGHANASFTSANADVRQLIESALPKLREMFASAGIELGQTHVSAESFKQQAEQGHNGHAATRREAGNAILGSEIVVGAGAIGAFTPQRGHGLIDLFA